MDEDSIEFQPTPEFINCYKSKFYRTPRKSISERMKDSWLNTGEKISTAYQRVKDYCASWTAQADSSEDKPKPECEVSLVFTRATTTSRVGLCSTSCSSDNLKRSCMHWKALFKFPDGHTTLYHAVQVNNLLRGRCEHTSTDPPGDEHAETVFIGKYQITEENLDKAFRRMNIDVEFHPILSNCQTWLVQLLEHLDIKLPDTVKTLAQQIHSYFRGGDQSKTFKFIAKAVHKAVHTANCSYAPRREQRIQDE